MTLEIIIGTRLKDNDPRMNGRVLTVVGMHSNRVTLADTRGRQFPCLRNRIFTDQKPRKSGLSVLP